MRVHSVVGLVTNSSSETYTMPRARALELVEQSLRALHPNVKTWEFTRVEWDGTDLDRRMIAQCVFDMGFSEDWESDIVHPFYDTEINVDDPETWTPEFKSIVDAVTPVLAPIIPMRAGHATDEGVPYIRHLYGKLEVIADGQLHEELSDEATLIACDILYDKGEYEYR